MQKFVTVAAVAVASLVVGSMAFAADSESYKVSAAMTSKAEVPAPKGAPGGKGTFSGTYVENAKGASLTWKLAFSALSGSATAAHIHMGKAGVAGPVLVPLCGPCKSGMNGKVSISKATIKALESGTAYVNVHTTKNPNGEIRGQVKVAD
jgi:hypothetical protein